AYARAHGVPVPARASSPYNVDVNMWGRSIGCGVLEDPWVEPPADIYTLTKNPADCPNEAAYVDLKFETGVPVAINGVTMSFPELIASAGTIAGAHGVGRIDMVENRIVGIKTREIYEAPAAVVLHLAHQELENFVSPRDLLRMKQEMALAYADMVYKGAWYSPVREAMDAFIKKVQERVTGTIRVKLFKGSAAVVGRTSPFTLYDRALATYGEDDAFDHAAAPGFITITGLPIETVARKWGLADGQPNMKKAT
ncbi:MAG: argininosuccinate synthase, partial [Acidobacteria bacterium]|nr:argininosuccinate synthase [Acidobacteriota bacterium]